MQRYRWFTSRAAARICPYAQKSAPERPNCTRKTGGFPRQERGFWGWSPPPGPRSGGPSSAFPNPPKSRATGGAAPPKKADLPQKNQKNKSPGGIEPMTTKTAITDIHGQWNDGLCRSTKGAPYSSHLLVFLVVVLRVFAYQVLPQCATTVPWAAAWAPSVSGCQYTQPAQK